MLFKDYYAILGLQRTASMMQIKRAFYKLALKYHPDKNPQDPASSDKFKEISEANKVLSDPEKRKKYDKIFIELKNGQSAKNRGYESYFAQQRKVYQNQTSYSHSSKTKSSSKKNSGFSDFINNFINTKSSSNTCNNSHNVSKNNPYRTMLHVSLNDVLHGATINLIIDKTKIPVYIPPGVVDGKEIIYHGFFSDSYPFLKRDLIVTVVVDQHPNFKRYNQSMMYSLEIDLYTAVLGGIKEIRTLNNKLLRLKIPRNTSSGTLFRLKGQGLPFSSNINLRGDLFVKISVHIPNDLSSNELKLFEQLSVLRKTASS